MTPAETGALGTFVSWTVRASLEASLLIGVVLVVRSIAGQRVSAKWRSALWLIVLLRLVVLWTPQSRFSVYNLIPRPVLQFPGADRTSNVVPAPPHGQPTLRAGGERLPQPSRWTRRGLLVAVWSAGAAAFALWLLIRTLSAVLAFRGRRPVTDKAILDLMEDCKEDLGVRTYLAVIETPRTQVPALFGWIRPRLLLPEGVLATLDREQVRHIFLHELAHLKRHDVAFNWSMALVQALHWFNPLIWVAFGQARADLELACDELALTHLPDHAPREYGNTILELLSTHTGPKRRPAFAALGEDAAQVKRRIRRIAVFRKGRYTSHLVSAAAILLLGCVFMVDASHGQGERPPDFARSLGVAAPTAAPAESAPGDRPLPGDAAAAAAERWMALADAGASDRTWEEAHSVVRGLISRSAWKNVFAELHRVEAAERGKIVSRRVVAIEYLTGLPLNLGDGVSVGFASRYEKGEFAGPKLLFAKDRDGQWRLVRSDKE